MDAYKLVKKYGWEICVDVCNTLKKSSWVNIRKGAWFSTEFVELPKLASLIKSKNIIDELGGIESALKFKNLNNNCCVNPKSGEIKTFTLNSPMGNYVGFSLFPEQINQAIADVEYVENLKL